MTSLAHFPIAIRLSYKVAKSIKLKLACNYHSLQYERSQKTAKGISETLAMSDESTEVIILNPLNHSGVSCAESYSAELQSYLLLL